MRAKIQVQPELRNKTPSRGTVFEDVPFPSPALRWFLYSIVYNQCLSHTGLDSEKDRPWLYQSAGRHGALAGGEANLVPLNLVSENNTKEKQLFAFFF